MSTLTRVVGFSVIKGSKDLPSGYIESEPFGFDIGETEDDIKGPIFQYSINDVESNFQECYTISSLTQLMSNCTLRLYTESSDNPTLKEQEFVTNADWKKALKLIEWVIINQSNINNLNSSDENYLNYADQKLAAELINEEVNSDRIDTYIHKSFSFVPSSTSSRTNRIGQFSFQITIDGSAVLFQIYLDADDFCNSLNSSESVKVFFFEEINHDGKLDNEEFLKAIIEPQYDILNGKRYNRLDVLDTRWFKRINPNNKDEGYEKESVTARFILYSNYRKTPDSAFPVESRMESVRKALIEKYGSLGPTGEKIVNDDLISQYPDLFTRNEVILIPFAYNNSLQIVGGDLIQGMHPITVLKILNTAKKYGYILQTETGVVSGTSKGEIFYVGGETPNDDSTNIFPFPILAIEKTDKNVYPITDRFPTYKPKYFDQNWPAIDTAEQFQFILAKCLGALDGKYTEEQLNSISSVVKVTVSKNDSGTIKNISFKFQNINWVIDNTSIDDNVR